MNHSFFITATDTGVGKTVVSALLACALRARGVDAGVMKPFATGCRLEDGRLVAEDAEFLRDCSGVEDDLELICPARWEEPLAPLISARRAGNVGEDWLGRCLSAYDELSRRHGSMIVEGVGGWAVPLGEREANGSREVYNVEDLAAELGLPVVLVARRTLGTLNHTLLSLRAIRARCELAAVVFCDAEPVGEDDLAAQTSHKYLCERENLILNHVPFEAQISPERVRVMAEQLDWHWL